MQRFWNKVDKTQSCWIWTAAKDQNGYGLIWFNGRLNRSHRVSWILSVGDIPPDLQIDHVCRNRACCNPAHLELVSSKENTHRGNGNAAIHARKIQCVNGHEFTPENTRWYTTPAGRTTRVCKACKRSRNKNRKLLTRA